MDEFFIFVLAFIWIVFASVQDLRTREVANWLTFSLIAFALTYRGFVALFQNEWWFFVSGVLGFALFFVIAHAFYYGKVFAGGDAKLLMGIGAVLPFHSASDFVALPLVFLLMLFFVGAFYSLVYSVVTSVRFSKRFVPAFAARWRKSALLWFIPLALSVMLVVVKPSWEAWLLLSAFFFFLPLAYIYLKAFEEGCLVVLLKPEQLTLGDWLERDVHLGKHLLRRNVHGLSLEEIALLRKYRKNVWIKQGIPFVPAFLVAFVIMVFFEIASLGAVGDWILSLFSAISASLPA